MSAAVKCESCGAEMVESAVPSLGTYCPKRCGDRDNCNSSTQLEHSVVDSTPVERPPLGELLDELAGFVRRFVVMSPAQADAIALWIVHTHVFDAAEVRRASVKL